ncbi:MULTISPECIES: class I SAM-dependent methyltransferase [Breznakia]|uniref:23S rRNA (Cytosine1962-C5)-methyltransferase n=1 Tax=Breznakia blatticola TaxID=1754012 RepID=A0A4R8A4R8_9FIRM|nr:MULTISPECIES: class I SAM-dependent methyltransferase [Breznakia]MDH6367176.1 23S rRNA (cytosine1962-C5)-methyltransferase [Breznakia sp. PH1-1]MDH6404404.1 23S rRNA (cytosine1962-C5)-methyltransferase [Breznakia sp. PF1-11]MDH6412113.1 23S rRNA (cytosine1962-C5)-methyltransferase [Breznakia sp. PFB1-11]MDH6414392.1 23S rRNA (cytosine1962-C5)-methyltransferase [Breznakia sp. PFB1-14]MDH6416678.1 23S rRNA (cytosine1962-C5)-methyltransferase [Breznakia sp. PFB1-4]
MKLIANNWKDYECIDCGNGEKLERWKNVILRRPDPQVIWPVDTSNSMWRKVDAHYHRSKSGGGHWEFIKKVPEHWTISYKELTFKVSPTGFKHTGLFPEQAANWDYMMDTIRNSGRDDIRVLNLFAYTGGATLACASAGASEVVHVDASKGMVNWAKENMQLSHLTDKKIRFIVEDCVKFVKREARRGRTYHAIIMDPPSYGRGPNGEMWKIEEQLYPLISACLDILDKDALFFLVNSYTTGLGATVLENVLHLTVKKQQGQGQVTCGEIGLPITYTNQVLPCGIYGRWEAK